MINTCVASHRGGTSLRPAWLVARPIVGLSVDELAGLSAGICIETSVLYNHAGGRGGII